MSKRGAEADAAMAHCAESAANYAVDRFGKVRIAETILSHAAPYELWSHEQRGLAETLDAQCASCRDRTRDRWAQYAAAALASGDDDCRAAEYADKMLEREAERFDAKRG